MRLSNYVIFCFVFACSLVTGREATAVLIEPFNSDFLRSNASGIDLPSLLGVNYPCSVECSNIHHANRRAVGATFRSRRNAEVGANDLWTPAYSNDVGFPIDFTPMHLRMSMGAGIPSMDIFASVHFADDALGLEAWILSIGSETAGTDVRPPWPAAPLPSALSLFLIALAGLIFLSLRRNGRLVI